MQLFGFRRRLDAIDTLNSLRGFCKLTLQSGNLFHAVRMLRRRSLNGLTGLVCGISRGEVRNAFQILSRHPLVHTPGHFESPHRNFSAKSFDLNLGVLEGNCTLA